MNWTLDLLVIACCIFALALWISTKTNNKRVVNILGWCVVVAFAVMLVCLIVLGYYAKFRIMRWGLGL